MHIEMGWRIRTKTKSLELHDSGMHWVGEIGPARKIKSTSIGNAITTFVPLLHTQCRPAALPPK